MTDRKCSYCNNVIAGIPYIETVNGKEYLLHPKTCAEEACSDVAFFGRISILEASRNAKPIIIIGS